MIHPDTQLKFISPEVGYGVFATKLIPRGTVTWVMDDFDQRFTPAQVAEVAPEYRQILTRYGFLDEDRNTVLSWDNARFVNHSCRPNSGSGCDDTFEVAIRDIQAGEQLTDDYGEFTLAEVFPCRCGHAECRGEVRPEDRRKPEDWISAQVRGALKVCGRVAQPLEVFALAHPRLRNFLEASGYVSVKSEDLATR